MLSFFLNLFEGLTRVTLTQAQFTGIVRFFWPFMEKMKKCYTETNHQTNSIGESCSYFTRKTNFALSPGKISLYPFIAQCKFPLCLIKIVMSLRMRGTFLFKVQVVMSSSSLITWPRPKNKGDVSEFMNLLKLFIWSLPGPRSGKKNRSVEEV